MIGLLDLINRNMRCIEMSETESVGQPITQINRNMRCIEMRHHRLRKIP